MQAKLSQKNVGVINILFHFLINSTVFLQKNIVWKNRLHEKDYAYVRKSEQVGKLFFSRLFTALFNESNTEKNEHKLSKDHQSCP